MLDASFMTMAADTPAPKVMIDDANMVSLCSARCNPTDEICSCLGGSSVLFAVLQGCEQLFVVMKME